MAANNLSRTVYSKIRPLLSAGIEARGIMVKRDYHEKVIDHYENPRNVGSFDKSDVNVGTGLVGAPACGDVMKLQVTSVLLIGLRFTVLLRSTRSKWMKMAKLSTPDSRRLAAARPSLRRHWRRNGSRASRSTKPIRSRIKTSRKNSVCPR